MNGLCCNSTICIYTGPPSASDTSCVHWSLVNRHTPMQCCQNYNQHSLEKCFSTCDKMLPVMWHDEQTARIKECIMYVVLAGAKFAHINRGT